MPGEEAEDQEDAGAAEEIPGHPLKRKMCAEGELGTECPCGGAEQGEKEDLLPSKEPACGEHRENEKGQRADLGLRGGVEDCTDGDGYQNECAGEKTAAESFCGAVFFGLDALSVVDENFGGAEDADELGRQEVVDEPLPTCAIMQESPLADGALDFFDGRRQWFQRAQGG